MVKAKPELANVEPFKTVLSGNREAIAKLPKEDLYKILAATLTGMSVEQHGGWLTARPFDRLARAKHGLTRQPFEICAGARVCARLRKQSARRMS